MKLKKLILALFLSFSATSLPVFSNSMDNHFCEGYKAGYTAGWEQVRGETPTRLSPFCPLMPLDTPNNEKAQFDRGYDVGLRAGVRDGSR
jgi:hypothetical protein